ncbi:MAG: hypothetical protein Kow00109_05700 [Acidobacteriota bacterium]
MRARLVVVGSLALGTQVVLLRELAATFYGVELIYVLGLFSWLLGTAAGSVWGAHTGASPSRLRIGFFFFPLPLFFSLVVARGWHGWLGGLPGGYLDFGLQLLGIASVTVLPALWLGVLFQWAARLHPAEGRLAKAYGWESLGAMLTGLAVTFAFWGGAQNLTVALALAAVALSAVLERRSRVATGVVAFGLTGLFFVAVQREEIDLRLLRWRYPEAAAVLDSPYGRWVIVRWGEQISVLQDGVLVWETDSTAAEELVHVAMVQAPAARRVLVLGGGLFGLARELLKYPQLAVETVEVDRAGYAFLESWLEEGDRGGGRSSWQVHFGDPRRFVEAAAASDRRWDVVFVAVGEPLSGRENRYYTEEFFAAVSRILADGGVLALSLPASENVVTELLARRTGSLIGALEASLPAIVILPGSRQIILASRRELVTDPEVLGARFAAAGVETRLVSEAYLTYLYTNDRREEIGRRLTAEGGVNRDLEPVCYRYALLLWLSRLFPAWSNRFPRGLESPAASRLMIGLPGLVLGATLLLVRRPLGRGAVLVAFAGCAGMLLETILLLHYQIKLGVLYRDLGLVLTLFMVGLAAGAPVVHGWTRRERWGASYGILVAALGAVEVYYLARSRMGGELHLGELGALLVVAGLVSAGVLGWVSGRLAEEGSREIGYLYGADVLGGACGALLGLAVIPWVGLPGAVLMLALATPWLVLARRLGREDRAPQ